MYRSARSASHAQPVTWREVMARRRLPLILVMCLAVWLHAANTLLAATTLPEAVGDIGGLRLISWAFALYLMGSIMAAAVVSAFVARAGLRRAMLASALLYTLGCIACAAAPAMSALLAGRTVQGLGGGALVALVFIVQNRFFPDRLVPRVVACLSLTWMVAALSGPLIGGLFATAGLWRFAFWSFALQGVVLALLLYPMLSRARSDVPLEERQLPIVRLMLVAGAILAIAFAGAATSILVSAVFLAAGCMSVWLFAVRDAAASHAFRLLPRHAISLAHPVGCGIAMTFVFSLCMMSFSVYGPIVLIRLYGLTPFEAGLVLVTESLGWGAGALLLSGLAPGYEKRLIQLGSVLLAAGFPALTWFVAFGPLSLVVATAFIGTAGFGMMWGYVIKHVVANAGRDDRDRASSMLPSTQQTAFAIGAALTGIIANILGFEHMSQPGEFRTAALWLFGAFVPPALIGTWIAWRFSRLMSPAR